MDSVDSDDSRHLFWGGGLPNGYQIVYALNLIFSTGTMNYKYSRKLFSWTITQEIIRH